MTTLVQKAPEISDDYRADGILLEGVSWDYYKRTIDELLRVGQKVRITYDDGRMEFMAPMSDLHENVKKHLARLIEFYAFEADVPITGRGSVTTIHPKKKKGVEPDECYYIQTAPPKIKGKPLDVSKSAPPDLVIEVDFKSASIPKEPIMAAMGVRELWRWEDDHITSLHLSKEGKYIASRKSVAFPNLPMTELNRFLRLSLGTSQHETLKAVQKWVRANSKP